MLSRIVGLVGVLLLCFRASAQETVTVHVHDKEKGDALDFAYVNVFSIGSEALVVSVVTDPNGNAELVIKKYPVRLEIRAIGFDPSQVVLESATDQTIDIPLSKRFASLNEVVVTGVVTPTKLQDALSTYQVLGKAAMQAQGAVNVADALKNQLNVNMGNDNVLGSKISMQGLGGDKVKVLVDGLPLNGREYGNIDLGQINLNNVERVEIVQGPMSVVYGTDALGGVINIITKKDKLPWQLQAGTYYETVGKYNFDVSGTYALAGGHQISIGGGRNFFQGWGPTDPLERSFLWNPKEQYLANLAYSYAPASSSFRLQFATDFVKEKITDKDADYTVSAWKADAFDKYYRTSRLNSRLILSGKLGKKGIWQSQNGYSVYYRTKNEVLTHLNTLAQEPSQSLGAQDTTRFNDVTLRGSYSNSIGKINWTAGYDITLENAKSGKLNDSINDIQNYGFYISAPVAASKTLTLQPALRYTYNTRFGAPLIPALNILYKASEAFQLRISYGKGFRAPTLKELYLHFYDNNHEIDGNPRLRAEEGDNYQVSASWTAYHKQTNFVRLLLTGYYNDVRDEIYLIQPDTARPTYATYTNLSRIRNLIGTAQAEAQWKNLYIQLGYSMTHILNIPGVRNASQASAAIQYFWTRPGINISTFIKYFGEQPRPSGNIVQETTFDGVTGAYTFFDASVEKKLFDKKLQLIVGVKNLLDVRSATINGASAAGSGKAHSGASSDGGENISTGRSFFTSLRLTLQ